MFQVIRHPKLRFGYLSSVYAGIAAASILASYWLRFDGKVPVEYEAQAWRVLGWFVAVRVAALVFFRQCHALPSFFSLVDAQSVVLANVLASGLLFGGTRFMAEPVARGILLADFLVATCGILAIRVFLRRAGEYLRDANRSSIETPSVAVAIIGAGAAGATLARDLLNKPGLRLRPVVFLDDDPAKWGQRIHGIPIAGAPEMLMEPPWRDSVRKAVIAMPTASAKRIGELVHLAGEVGITSATIPSMDQLVSGTLKVTQLRSVTIDDLLRREAVNLDTSSIRQILRDQVVMVTGAGGSIGSEICRQILAEVPRRLLLVERSEVQMFPIEQELIGRGGQSVVTPLIADITDEGRMRELLARHRPSVVFHAAAHKHVPLMESQPDEAIRNNSFGTATLARLCLEHSVARFVLISTDKAINPTNAMGASKRLAEI